MMSPFTESENEMKISPKQAHINQRLVILLTAAEKLISQVGFEKFKLDDLIQETGYSRPTIYKVFKTKDNLLLHLALKTFNLWATMAKKAYSLEGLPREKLLVLHISEIIIFNMYPSGFRAIFYVNTPYFRNKSNSELFEHFDKHTYFFMKCIADFAQEAIDSKHFTLPAGIDVKEFSGNLWSFAYGSMSMTLSEIDPTQDFINSTKKFVRVICDSLGWKPTSAEHDYDKIAKKIIGDLFPLEYAQIKGNNPKFK